ncbi:DUF899 domain-containing protein [Micromonospora sp. NPDC048935]|uniref:DUF899 domain-containing protein n=1 Tax=Micromonospora sp. NPDC048935 TaxID=3364262 RepID=UPI00370FDA35
MSRSKVVTREEWLIARRDLLEKEKEVTKARDMIAAARRELPMVRVENDYRFDGPDGEVTLLDLFEGRRQLIVRHFMFAPEDTEGCIGCSMQTDSVGELSHMWARDTTFVLVSRAPLAKLEAFKKRMGWTVPWYSSGADSDFNRDYEVTTELGDSPGVSAFYREGDEVFHTYSIYDRGGDIFKSFYNYLDITHLGRQEDQLEHPWDWWRHKDRYDDAAAVAPGNNWWNGTRFQS